MKPDYFFTFKQKLYEAEDQFKLPGGWKILPIGEDHEVLKTGQPYAYGIFMTDKHDPFYFDSGDHRDAQDIFPTQQKAYDMFMKNYNTPGTDFNHWKKQQERK